MQSRDAHNEDWGFEVDGVTTATVEEIGIFHKGISSSVECPKCGNRDCDLLSTTNEFCNYCKPCDIRFNDAGEVYAG
jgi:hypothetical protein